MLNAISATADLGLEGKVDQLVMKLVAQLKASVIEKTKSFWIWESVRHCVPAKTEL